MKKSVLKICATVAAKAAYLVTAVDVNVSCPCIGYQPKIPETARRLKSNYDKKDTKIH